MNVFIATPQKCLPALLLVIAFLFLIKPAGAWDSHMDSLRICNTNKNHDVDIAIASKAVPWGVAALMGAGWRREGWWTVKAGQCEHTMRLRDVQNYEVWLFVEVGDGIEITWPTSKEQFCIHPKDAFEAFAWSMGEIQKCAEGERLGTFSHLSSLYNEADNYSIYSVANRTIELEFDLEESPAPPAPSTAAPPIPPKPPKTASIHPDTGKLVQTGKSAAQPAASPAATSGAVKLKMVVNADEAVGLMLIGAQNKDKMARLTDPRDLCTVVKGNAVLNDSGELGERRFSKEFETCADRTLHYEAALMLAGSIIGMENIPKMEGGDYCGVSRVSIGRAVLKYEVEAGRQIPDLDTTLKNINSFLAECATEGAFALPHQLWNDYANQAIILPFYAPNDQSRNR